MGMAKPYKHATYECMQQSLLCIEHSGHNNVWVKQGLRHLHLWPPKTEGHVQNRTGKHAVPRAWYPINKTAFLTTKRKAKCQPSIVTLVTMHEQQTLRNTASKNSVQEHKILGCTSSRNAANQFCSKYRIKTLLTPGRYGE